jgi:hypothetical protein
MPGCFGRHRRGRGHDLQRNCAQVLETVNRTPASSPAVRPERDLARGGRGQDVADRDLADGARLESDDAYGTSPSGSSRRRCRDGMLPRRRPGVHRPRGGAGSSRRQPSALADERDQPADLAGGDGGRHQPEADRTAETAGTPSLEGTTVLTAPPDAGAYERHRQALASCRISASTRPDSTSRSRSRERGRRLDRMVAGGPVARLPPIIGGWRNAC